LKIITHYNKPTMSFSIGIRYDPYDEGFCDIHLNQDKQLSAAQLEEIIQICNDTILIPGTFHTMNTLCAIADVIGLGNMVELDLNLQHYTGAADFGKGAVHPTLIFCRPDIQWPESIFEYNSATTPLALWRFLFEPFGLRFHIGIVNKKNGARESLCDVNLPFDKVEQLDCLKMIQLLEDELQYGADGMNPYKIMEKLQPIIGGFVMRNDRDSDFGNNMKHIDLVFIRNKKEMIYSGDTKVLKEFLTA